MSNSGFGGTGGGDAKVGAAGRPGSATLYDTRTARRAVEVPTAATAAVATTATTTTLSSSSGYACGQRGQRSSSFPDGSRREYGADASDSIGSNTGRNGGRRGHQRPRTSTGSRRTAYQCIVDLLPPVSAAAKTTANAKGTFSFHSPTGPSRSAKTRPTSSPRKLTSGGGGGGSNTKRTTRASESGPTELIMPTVSLCLGGVDDCFDPLADSTPDDHHRFMGDSSARGAQHMRHRVSPASLLAQATAATAASPVPGRLPANRAYGGGSLGGHGGGGDGSQCIRSAEATAVGSEDKSAARSHGFRRWRPGESGNGGRAKS